MMLYFAADSTNVIQIGTVESVVGILAIVLAVGIAWGTLRTKVINIDKDVDEIKKDTKAFTSDIAAIKTIVYREYQSKYAKQNSPRQLTEKGLHVLEKSGIRGGIYFRDYALPEIGFNVVDIDKNRVDVPSS